MPSKREMLEEILYKMESMEQSQREMAALIHKLQLSQLQQEQTNKVIELLQSETAEPLSEQPSDLNSNSSTAEAQNPILGQVLALFDTQHQMMNSSISELHAEVSHMKSLLNRQLEHSSSYHKKLDELSSNTYSKMDGTNTALEDLQQTVHQMSQEISEIQLSQSAMNDQLTAMNVSPESMDHSVDVDEVNIPLTPTQEETELNDYLKTSVDTIQHSIEEVKTSIFELQAGQSISNLSIQEMQTLQNNLQHAVAELQVSNIELNQTIDEMSTSHNELKESINEWQVTQQLKNDSIEKMDLQPITSQIDKYSDRINLLKNYIDRLHEEISRVVEEIHIIKGHTIKNSTLLTPLNHIVPKILQIEADMNILNKQVESSSFQLTQELIKRIDVVKP